MHLRPELEAGHENNDFGNNHDEGAENKPSFDQWYTQSCTKGVDKHLVALLYEYAMSSDLE